MSLRNKENLKWFIVFVKLSSLRNVFYGTVSRCITIYEQTMNEPFNVWQYFLANEWIDARRGNEHTQEHQL